VETLRVDGAVMHVDTPAATTIAAVSTPVKAAGSTKFETTPVAKNFTMPVSNRLQYSGIADREVSVDVAVSISSTSNAQTVGIYVAKNGTTIPSSEIFRKTGTGGDIGAAPTQARVNLTNGDYVELFVSNETTATNVTVEKMSFRVSGLAL
jgi:hypothetical protein